MRDRHFVIMVSVVAVMAIMALVVSAGNPANPPGPPETTYSYNLDDIHSRLVMGAVGVQTTFVEPSEGPLTGTMYTLNDIMAVAPEADEANGATQTDILTGRVAWGLTSQEWGVITGTRSAAPVLRTGQITSYATGDDGDLETGVGGISSTRFVTDVTGVVTDTLTGLVWLQDANCIASEYPGFDNDVTSGDGRVTWQHALDFVAGMAAAGPYANCAAGLSDWRLPNIRELLTLLDYGNYTPALPDGHPFTGVSSSSYWSDTTLPHETISAYRVSWHSGGVLGSAKTDANYVWPVRGGQ